MPQRSKQRFKTEQIMVKLFALMRQKNLCTIICVPNFFTLDSYARDHRVDSLVYVHQKGKYICYVKKAIKIISDRGRKTKSVGGHKLPDGTYFPGYYIKDIPELNDLDEESYRRYKSEHFNEFLGELQKAVNMQKKDSKFATIRKACEILPISPPTMKKMAKEGKIKGKKIGGRWYIDKKSLIK